MTKKLRIFVGSESFPRPDIAAGDKRLFSMIEIMSRRHDVTLFVNSPLLGSCDLDRYIQQLEYAGTRRIERGFWRMNRVMARYDFDLAIFEFFQCEGSLGKEFRRSQPGVPVLVDSVDLHYVREAKRAELHAVPAEVLGKNKAREIQAYERADGVVMVTPEDDLALKTELPAVRTWLVPIICPIVTRPQLLRDRELLFIGGFQHLPNVDGMLWFTGEIWPLIRQQFPDAKLTIVGSNAPEQILALEKISGIIVVGYVPETAPYLERASVSIAPLRFGAGMKGKVTEALAAAVPIVTTSFGAQGFSAIDGEHLLVADDPTGFANHAIRLLKFPELAESIGRNGQNLVKRICSPEVVADQLECMLQEAASMRRSSVFLGQRTLYRASEFASLSSRIASRVFRSLIPRT